MASKIEQPTDLWDLEHYLTESRKRIDRTYDYRYSGGWSEKQHVDGREFLSRWAGD